MSDFNYYGGSPFRVKRPLITTNGIVSEIDPTIKAHLDELNSLLAKRVIATAPASGAGGTGSNGTGGNGAAAGAASPYPDVLSLLSLPLSAKHTPPIQPASTDASGSSMDVVTLLDWDENTLAWELSELPDATNDPNSVSSSGAYLVTTLSDLIDATSPLSALKYSFQNNLSGNWNNLDYNTRVVLDGYSSICDYLIAYGYFVMGLTEVNGLTNFILSNRLGTKNIVNYAVLSAARTIVDREQLLCPECNQDGPPQPTIVLKILNAGLTLSSASFSSALQSLINAYLFNKNETVLIARSGYNVPPELAPQLIQLIKTFPIPINDGNASLFLPGLVSQIVAGGGANGTTASTPGDTSNADFDVQYLTDDQTMIQVSQSAVRCAAQLFYSMVLGDELKVLHVMNYFTHKYLLRGSLEITDNQLRNDLQLYVFSNKFTDLKTGAVQERSRPGERRMFYKQVFDWGNGQVTEDVIVNREFPKLWKVLILESANYLERAQMSPNPDSYVSRQNVMQAVEDLQYNLSTHCTGMANVITPMIYAELNFVIRRVFMHDEVLKQIAPQGGTWWRVVEALYMDAMRSRPRSTVLYNKAKLGDSILRQIANYNPSTFENDGPFSAFISDVEAFITTQSILQQGDTEDERPGERDERHDRDQRNGDRRDADRHDADSRDVDGRDDDRSRAQPQPAGAVPAGSDEWAF